MKIFVKECHTNFDPPPLRGQSYLVMRQGVWARVETHTMPDSIFFEIFFITRSLPTTAQERDVIYERPLRGILK